MTFFHLYTVHKGGGSVVSVRCSPEAYLFSSKILQYKVMESLRFGLVQKRFMVTSDTACLFTFNQNHSLSLTLTQLH